MKYREPMSREQASRFFRAVALIIIAAMLCWIAATGQI